MTPRKLPYQAVPDGFRGSVKRALNAILNPAGLEIRSTLEKHIEDARLRKLRERGHWLEPRYTQGFALDSEAALAFLTETCGPYRAEWERLPQSPNGDESQYFLDNDWFRSVDAEVLYCVMRRFQPANVVEVGSGFSTRLMRRAIIEGKLATRVTSIDPHPNTSVQPYADEYIRAAVEDLESTQLLDLLSAGDILFIDSSHTVKTGGDVPYLFLEILPRLRPGVLIHIHDIFLPFDYPEEWVLEDWRWNEQYLLHAFLSYNQAFEILWPASYVWARHRSEVLRLISTASPAARPSSLWMKKRY
jgi:predicted O-methyltransferase YrrM